MKMKKKSSLLIGILILAMIFGIFTVVFAPVRADPDTFTVIPTGGDDTANIQKAFDDAIAAGPGSTVQLAAGQFYTNEIIVENFYGTLKGAGEATKIDVLRGLDPLLPGVSIDYLTYSAHLFIFFGGDVHISDLSFDITPYEPAEPWGPNDPLDWYDLLAAILITGDINSRIENVKFTGHEGTALYPDFHPMFSVKSYNVRVGVEYGGGIPTGGTHVITNCDFNSLWLGITAWGLMNCELTITSNSIKGGAIGIINAESTNSEFEISGNDIEADFLAGIWVMQFATPPCKWLITGNTIRPLWLTDGITLEDYTGSGALKAIVSHNEIILDTFWGGMWTNGVKNIFIYRNFISGTGDYGITLATTDKCLILSNRISNSAGNGLVLLGSNKNKILGNYFRNNGGFGLAVFTPGWAGESNGNCIVANLFYNNALGNIYDECDNKYKWNLEF
ncbi:MAG: NosD domain-containing protein [Candidatus Odinarchaeota archaeon]